MNVRRYELNKKLAFQHFCHAVNDSNELSRNVFKILDLEEGGRFFTLLPSEVDIQCIHNFTNGGIAKTSRDVVISFLLRRLLRNKNHCIIFDDVLEEYRNLLEYDLFINNGVHYGDEVYYLLDSKRHPSLGLMRECLRASDTGWHCLGILSLLNVDQLKNQTLTLRIMRNLCVNADLILTTSYDGEGYIFWERVES